MLQRILIGYDGTEQAVRALDYAVKIAEGTTAEPIMIHLAYIVQKRSEIADPVPQEVSDSLENAGREILTNGARMVKKRLGCSNGEEETGDGSNALGIWISTREASRAC